MEITYRNILPIGQFFAQTADGRVCNPASHDRLVPPWTDALGELCTLYERELGPRLHSIYLRGSVAFGTALPGFSDLDSFCLVYPEAGECVIWQPLLWAGDPVRRRLPFPCDVEFALVTVHRDMIRANPILAMLIKTQSLCLRGPDISPDLPDFRPGPAMLMDAELLARDLARFRESRQADMPLPTERLQALMKRILRSGFELVMEREGRYTTSLYLHYECFARHYPDRERDMRRVLEIFLNPASRWPEMPAFINDFGGWLCLEASDVLSRHWRNQG